MVLLFISVKALAFPIDLDNLVLIKPETVGMSSYELLKLDEVVKKYISSDTLAIDALELMEKYAITTLFSYSHPKLKKPDGIVHIHTIL